MKAGITCANAASQKLAAIRIGTGNNEIKKSPSVRPEIRTISYLAMVKYRSKLPPGTTGAELEFGLMEELAGAASLELEFHTSDAPRLENLIPTDRFASPAADTVENPFVNYPNTSERTLLFGQPTLLEHIPKRLERPCGFIDGGV